MGDPTGRTSLKFPLPAKRRVGLRKKKKIPPNFRTSHPKRRVGLRRNKIPPIFRTSHSKRRVGLRKKKIPPNFRTSPVLIPGSDFENCFKHLKLSSPRAKRAESARAVSGRRCPHSGEGEDFLMGQLNFLKKTAVTPETESRKIDPKVGN